MFRSIPILFQLIGSSLKILPAAVWDESHILLTSLYKITWPKNLSLQFLILWQIYMILLAILNGYGNSVAFYRYILVFFALFLLKGYYRRMLNTVSRNSFFIIGYAYLSICILLYSLGNYMNLAVAWWQEWLWVGTAYSAYMIYIIVALAFAFSNTLGTRLIFIVTGYAAGIAMDSRLTLLLLTTLLPLMGFGLSQRNYRLSPTKRFYWICINLGFLISAVFLVSNNMDQLQQGFRSVDATIQDFLVEDTAVNRDVDRQDNLLAVSSLLDQKPFYFFTGTGLTSHQYELSGFLNKSSDGRIRPSGLPAMVFDGGIFYICIILMCAFSSAGKALLFGFNGLIRPWVSCLWISMILNSLLVTLITNTSDLMVWWAVLLSGSIINKDLLIKYKTG